MAMGLSVTASSLKKMEEVSHQQLLGTGPSLLQHLTQLGDGAAPSQGSPEHKVASRGHKGAR